MWRDFFRAMARPFSSCPHCGSDRVRVSGHVYGPLAALMGVRAYRCESCHRRFPVRAWLSGARSGPPPEVWPPEHWPPQDWTLPVSRAEGDPGAPSPRLLIMPRRWLGKERRIGERRVASVPRHGAERRAGDRRRTARASS